MTRTTAGYFGDALIWVSGVFNTINNFTLQALGDSRGIQEPSIKGSSNLFWTYRNV
jgi:hypothetical protein